MARKRLGEMLVEAGLITEMGLRSALAEQRRWGGTLGRKLVDMKLVTESEMIRVLSHQLAIEIVDLDKLTIPKAVLDMVSADLAVRNSVIPFAQPMKFLDIAMSDPTNVGIIDEIRIRTQLNVRAFLAGPRMIERAIAHGYRRGLGMIDSADADIPLIHDAIEPDSAAVQVPDPDHESVRRFPWSPPPASTAMAPHGRDAEINALQARVQELEALVARDEDVLRKVLAILVEKGVTTREEMLGRIHDDDGNRQE